MSITTETTFMQRIFGRLQRVTSSGKFIPEIDGLRFIAIASVFLFHVYGRLEAAPAVNSATGITFWKSYLSHGGYGVQLFFAISGFILALPFAKHYLENDRRPSMKQYFLRRVTRLEPPYFIVMIAFFFYYAFFQHIYSIKLLLLSLLASLTYTHNFIFGLMQGRDVLPLINGVAWTLEIEVQFYILAPLLAKFLFKSQNGQYRRFRLVAIMLLFVFFQSIYSFPFRWLYDQIQYFLLGFLLADLYVKRTAIKIPKWIAVLAGIFALSSIWVYSPADDAPWLARISWGVFLPTMIFVLYYLTLFTDFWKQVFSKRILTTIGGMCYSIYLIHTYIISSVAGILLRFRFSSIYELNWLIMAIIITVVVLVISSVFFVLIERPCMERDWYKKLPFFNRRQPEIDKTMMVRE